MKLKLRIHYKFSKLAMQCKVVCYFLLWAIPTHLVESCASSLKFILSSVWPCLDLAVLLHAMVMQIKPCIIILAAI